MSDYNYIILTPNVDYRIKWRRENGLLDYVARSNVFYVCEMSPMFENLRGIDYSKTGVFLTNDIDIILSNWNDEFILKVIDLLYEIYKRGGYVDLELRDIMMEWLEK